MRIVEKLNFGLIFTSQKLFTMEDSGGGVKNAQLTDSNYHSWKQKIGMLLSLRDRDHSLEEGIPTNDDDEKAKWIRADRKAMADIGFSLSDEQLEHVRDAKREKGMRDAIVGVFECHTLQSKLSARRKF